MNTDYSNTISNQFVIKKYPYPYPEDGKQTQRQKTLEKVCWVTAGLGFGLMSVAMLAPVSLATLIAVGVGFSVLSISLLARYGLSKINEIVAVKKIQKSTRNNIDQITVDLHTRLGFAANKGKGNWLMVKFLLFLGANPNMTYNDQVEPALHDAIQGKARPTILEDLLGAGADVNCYSNYNTPLSAALNKNDYNAAVKTLLKWGADPNSRARPHDHALFHAALNGRTKIVKALVTAGASLENRENGSEFDGETALCAAISQGHFDTVKALIRLGANKHTVIDDKTGRTVLEMAQHYYLTRTKSGSNKSLLERLIALETILEYLNRSDKVERPVEQPGFIPQLTAELPELPEEVLMHILSDLSALELATSSMVSKKWKLLADDNSLWKPLCVNEFPASVFQRNISNWKDHYSSYPNCSRLIANKSYSQAIATSPRPCSFIDRTALSPDGKLMAEVYRGKIALFDALNGKYLQTISTKEWVKYLSFSKDGSKIIAMSPYELAIWNINKLSKVNLISIQAHSFDTSFDGKYLVIGSPATDQGVMLWDISSSPTQLTAFGNKGDGKQVALSPDHHILTASDDEIKLWDMDHPEAPLLAIKSNEIRSIALSNDGKSFAVGIKPSDNGGAIQVYETETGQMLNSYLLYDVTPQKITFLPNDKLLYFKQKYHDESFFINFETGKITKCHQGEMSPLGKSFMQHLDKFQRKIAHYTRQSAPAPLSFWKELIRRADFVKNKINL